MKAAVVAVSIPRSFDHGGAFEPPRREENSKFSAPFAFAVRIENSCQVAPWKARLLNSFETHKWL